VQWVGKYRGHALEWTHHECWQRFAGEWNVDDADPVEDRSNEENAETTDDGVLRQMRVACAGSHAIALLPMELPYRKPDAKLQHAAAAAAGAAGVGASAAAAARGAVAGEAVEAGAAAAVAAVWSCGYCSPRHPTRVEPSSLESNGTL